MINNYRDDGSESLEKKERGKGGGACKEHTVHTTMEEDEPGYQARQVIKLQKCKVLLLDHHPCSFSTSRYSPFRHSYHRYFANGMTILSSSGEKVISLYTISPLHPFLVYALTTL